jgi:hypothetical protein
MKCRVRASCEHEDDWKTKANTDCGKPLGTTFETKSVTDTQNRPGVASDCQPSLVGGLANAITGFCLSSTQAALPMAV